MLVLLVLVVLIGLHRAVRTPLSALRSPRFRVSAGPGRRGTILDRNGGVLAKDSARSETGAQDAEPGGKLERVYPLGETAANLIGFISAETQDGAAGLELGMDSALSRHSDRPLRVTIDALLQRAVFQTLQRYVSSTRTARAAAVVMLSATGEILALADYPGYDPTRARMYPSEVWRCHAATDELAPGPLVGDWWLKTEGGRQVAKEFGLGRPTGIGLPDEAAGVLADSLPAIRVSLLQLVQAYSAIANKGRMNRSMFVSPQTASRKPQAAQGNQVIESAIAAKAMSALIRSAASGLEFAGTGGAFGPDSLIPNLVYVGVFPAGEPKYVVGVMLDRPLAGYYTPETARLLCGDIGRQVSEQ